MHVQTIPKSPPKIIVQVAKVVTFFLRPIKSNRRIYNCTDLLYNYKEKERFMNNNNLLILGICTIITGILLFIYSVNSYAQINSLSNKIDFDELENNNRMPTSDKYYKHLSYAEILNQYLEKNKNLPIKNTSCVYLDYAQHNTVSLYKLIYKGSQEDNSRREIVQINIEKLNDMLNNYRSCTHAPEYKKELDNILDDIEKINNINNNNSLPPYLQEDEGVEHYIERVPTDNYEQIEPHQQQNRTIEDDIIPTSDIEQNAPIIE